MKLASVQRAEAVRTAMIREIERALEQVFAVYGSHTTMSSYELALQLTDKIDFDMVAGLVSNSNG